MRGFGASRAELFAALDAPALRGLPERTRHIFLLNRIHGKSYSEIASLLDISSSAVEKHMMRALQACKSSLGAPIAKASS